MNVKNQKELWEAFRNKEREIVVEGDTILVQQVKLFHLVGNLRWFFVVSGAIIILSGLRVGVMLNKQLPGVGFMPGAISVIAGLVCMGFGIGMVKGKFGMPGQLANYRKKVEWGVVTLTRKEGK